MYLSSLGLQKFRNYKAKSLSLTKNTTLLVGDNAVGKTNILEAIYLLATGRSFRATKEQQMILYGEEMGRVMGDIRPLKLAKNLESKGYSSLTAMDSKDGETLEIVLTTGEVVGQRAPRKRYLVNGVGKRKMDFVGRLKCVLFRPEDIELVLGSPSVRREYMDSVLEQVDREYRRSSLSYQKGLRQRNKLLEAIREGEAERKQLLFWDRLLIKNGEMISQKRQEFLEFVNQELKEKGLDLKLEYDKSVVSEARLKKYVEAEIASAKTLVGPHRDDFEIISQRRGKLEKNLSIYGSRGEQRMAVLAIKLAELEFIKQATEDKPVLLLDDIFSELDEENRDEVLKLLEKQQTIMTTSDEQLIPEGYRKKVDLIGLS